MLQMIKDMTPYESPKKIRIKFSKGGALIYISHLDLVRTMTRAIVRARIPVKYTEGYNPIPKLTFATPLSVGCASVCEYLDIKITHQMSLEDIKSNLASQMPEGLDVLDVYEPQSKFTDAVYSTYKIEICDPYIDTESAEIVKNKFSQAQLVITKRSKSGDKEVNILPYIKDMSISSEQGKLTIETMLCVSSADYLNPEYVAGIAYDALNITNENFDVHCGYTILRNELYLADMKTAFR